MGVRNAISTIGRDVSAVNERLLSLKDAASQLSVSPSWLSQSDIPFVKLGRRRLYRPSDIAAYVSARVSHRISRVVP